MASRVYVAVRGEKGQGYVILGVFNEHSSAVNNCLCQPCHPSTGEWIARGGKTDYWTDGGDYVEVIECWMDGGPTNA